MRTTFEFRVGYTIDEYFDGRLTQNPCPIADDAQHPYIYEERNRRYKCELCNHTVYERDLEKHRYYETR